MLPLTHIARSAEMLVAFDAEEFYRMLDGVVVDDAKVFTP